MDQQLSPTDRERYRRQLMLPGFTADHQRWLGRSTALVAGIGGLGGTAALYLAAAGIGRLILVHAGNLTLSNLNRQVLMKYEKIGTSRVGQARQTIKEMNPDVEIEIVDERITEANVESMLRTARIALSARPNFS